MSDCWGIIRYNCLIQVSEWLLVYTKSAIFSYITMRTSYKLYFDELTDSEPNNLWSSSLILLAQQRNSKYLWSLVWPIWCNTQAQKNDVKSILSTWYMDVPFIFHFNMTGFECLLWNSLQIGPSKIWFDYTMYIFMLSFIFVSVWCFLNGSDHVCCEPDQHA